MPTEHLATGFHTPDETLSAREMHDFASRAASGFRSLGIVEGDVVAILMRNDLPFLQAMIGANICGAYAVPVNWHLAPAEVDYVLKDCGARVLVGHADLLHSIRQYVPDDMVLLSVSTPPTIAGIYKVSPENAANPAGAQDWYGWVKTFQPWDGPSLPVPGSMIYTSGTTGKPKGVKRVPMAPDALRRYTEQFKSVYGVDEHIRTMISTPLYHASPNSFGRFAMMGSDFTLLLSKFDAEEMLQMIEKHRINNMTTVPAVFVRLLKLPQDVRDKYDMSSLKWISHTGAACPPEVKKAMMDWWGPIIHETYGGTEVGMALHCNPQDWLSHPGTVGRTVKDCDIKLYDDDGNEVKQGEPGEIYVKNDAFPNFTYLNSPEKRASADRGGYVSIGDVGYFDADGFLYLCDRKSDMVIFGGTNVYPAEIESALVQNPGIADCAVIGIPDPDFGEVLMGYVTRAKGSTVTAEELQKWLSDKIAGYKIPKKWEFVDQLPREESGKIMKRKLKELHKPAA